MVGSKRKVKDEPIILDEFLLPKLAQIVQKVNWDYKANSDLLKLRDKALVCFLILTGVRNSETQKLRKKQIRNYKRYMLVANVQPLKHGKLRDEIILPKQGGFAPFTAIFEEWFMQIPDDESILFPPANCEGELLWNKSLSRQRIHWIIKHTTGMFPHWFRGVCETIYGKQIFKNDAWALKDFMGLVNLENTSPYVSSQWKIHERNVYKVK